MTDVRRAMAAAAISAALCLGGPASAQLGLPGVGVGLPAGPLTQPLGALPQTLDGVASGAMGAVRDLARAQVDRLRDLVRANPADLDLDPDGALIVRAEVMAISPSPAGLAAAERLGFAVVERQTLDELGLEVVTLRAPRPNRLRTALRDLRRADPQGAYDYNHIYLGSGQAPAGRGPGATPAPSVSASTVTLGLVDTGVETTHPAFSGARIEQRGFAPGGVKPASHGTAVGSLMVGEARGFVGAAPGARLLVADVYGSSPKGGSVQAIAAGLNWVSASGAGVINISLVGPANALLKAAVDSLRAKGVLIVAPVGNDGPSAPPSYPASYPGVVSVTGVTGRDVVLVEAGKALHVDFAAPGADIRAAAMGGGFAPVRGTSFAAPIVAGRLGLAARGGQPSLDALAAQARDLGARTRRHLWPRPDRRGCAAGSDRPIKKLAVGRDETPRPHRSVL